MREGHPLKQGLKPEAIKVEDDAIRGERGTSIKTRIETHLGAIPSQYPHWVREGHPLKQGLKPVWSWFLEFGATHVREGHPLKQGLKQHKPRDLRSLPMGVREGHPLKQGLKLQDEKAQISDESVREGHPLKQGLKRKYPNIAVLVYIM